MVTVPKLLARLAAIPAEAKALLAERNLTDTQLANGAGLVARVQAADTAPPAEPVDPAERERALAEAENRMWSHYLEWSKILRAQVKRPRYLALMGFGTGTRKEPPVEPASDNEKEDDLGEPDEM